VTVSIAASIKGKQLPAHSVSIENYSGIARFPCDSTVLVSLPGIAGKLGAIRQCCCWNTARKMCIRVGMQT